jgi:hypothetical protein
LLVLWAAIKHAPQSIREVAGEEGWGGKEDGGEVGWETNKGQCLDGMLFFSVYKYSIKFVV